MKISSAAAIIHTTFMAIVICFQLALAAGMPWGEYAMGGKFPGQFPIEMRVTAAIQVIILSFIAALVLSRAGLAFSKLDQLSRRLIWFVVGISVIGTVLNAITPSAGERIIWLPIALTLLFSSFTVARYSR